MEDLCTSKDLLRNKAFGAMLGLTVALVFAQAVWPRANIWFAVPLLLSWASFCGVNAVRCGRVHCLATAPLFVIGALVLLLIHHRVVLISDVAFNAALLGGVFLAGLAEIPFGMYVKRS